MTKPVEKTDAESRKLARRMRDAQWAFADRVAELGTLWFCQQDKERRHADVDARPADLFVTDLIGGMELAAWLRSHPDWWEIGEWDAERYATPVRLTDAGRKALKNRKRYDMEPVEWGRIEPGFTAVPAEKLT